MIERAICRENRDAVSVKEIMGNCVGEKNYTESELKIQCVRQREEKKKEGDLRCTGERRAQWLQWKLARSCSLQ